MLRVTDAEFNADPDRIIADIRALLSEPRAGAARPLDRHRDEAGASGYVRRASLGSGVFAPEPF